MVEGSVHATHWVCDRFTVHEPPSDSVIRIPSKYPRIGDLAGCLKAWTGPACLLMEPQSFNR
jgi:hypothetical protein